MFNYLFSKTYHRQLLEMLLKKHSSELKDTILDIGSKNQRYSYLFKGQVTAVDLKSDPDKQVIQGDLNYTLPFKNSSFNGIVCVEVLEYVHDLDHAVAEIHRLLVPGGVALVSIPFMYHDHDDYARYTLSKIQQSLKNFSHVTCIPFGNGWTVIYDILLKKTLSYSSRLKRLPGLTFLLVYHFFITLFHFEQHTDRYYSGIFIIIRT